MAPDSLLGTTVGRYRVDSVIGRGGMSVVYLAYDEQLGRRVALKVLSSELSEDEAFRARFHRESQLAAALEHPNIVPVYEAGEANDLLFIAMRFVEGTDLRQLLNAQGRLSSDQAIRLLRPIAAALDIAHRRGLIHRDVKPANILISQDESGAEHPYLSDFGLSKHATSKSGLTKTGQFMGTIDYVAPEQVQGPAEVDGRTDQYSFACVLFESLTGKVPFERDSDIARVFAHLQDEPPLATSVRPDLPPTIDDVLAHGMAKDKDDRYGTCMDLVDAASSALTRKETGSPPEAAPPPTVVALPPSPPTQAPAETTTPPAPSAEPTTRPPVEPATPSRSRRGLLAGGVLAAVAVIAGVIVLTQVLGGGPDGPTGGTTGGTGDATGDATGPTGGDPNVFADDFSDPQSGWGTRISPTFSAEYVEGEYVVTVTNGVSAYQELKGHGVSGDIRIEADARATTTDLFYYGVTCHGVDPTPTTGRAYYFVLSTEGDYAIGRFDLGANLAFKDYVIDSSPAVNPAPETNTIEATCVLERTSMILTLTVNGVLLDSVTVEDPFLPEGRSGFALQLGADTTSSSAAYDNFTATEL